MNGARRVSSASIAVTLVVAWTVGARLAAADEPIALHDELLEILHSWTTSWRFRTSWSRTMGNWQSLKSREWIEEPRKDYRGFISVDGDLVRLEVVPPVPDRLPQLPPGVAGRPGSPMPRTILFRNDFVDPVMVLYEQGTADVKVMRASGDQRLLLDFCWTDLATARGELVRIREGIPGLPEELVAGSRKESREGERRVREYYFESRTLGGGSPPETTRTTVRLELRSGMYVPVACIQVRESGARRFEAHYLNEEFHLVRGVPVPRRHVRAFRESDETTVSVAVYELSELPGEEPLAEDFVFRIPDGVVSVIGSRKPPRGNIIDLRNISGEDVAMAGYRKRADGSWYLAHAPSAPSQPAKPSQPSELSRAYVAVGAGVAVISAAVAILWGFRRRLNRAGR